MMYDRFLDCAFDVCRNLDRSSAGLLHFDHPSVLSRRTKSTVFSLRVKFLGKE
jgi:hypothetical protein